MGKLLGSILQTIVGAVLTQIPGLQGVGISLIASGVTSGILIALTPGPQKPETTETAIKKPRPERVSAYGRARPLALIVAL